MQTNKIKTVFLYSITHLLIDAACIFVLYSTVKFNNLESSILAFIIIVLYNTIAFGVQAFIGNIFDRNKKPKICAIIGCLLTISAVLFWRNPIITSILAGFGNAAFHVGGGIICLKLGNKKALIPGIYVAPGAMGVFIGAMFHHTVIDPTFSKIEILAICTFLSLLGQYGDLVFSAIKRYFGKKDFSNLMPGHGGILDRLDSIIFVLLGFMFFIY